MTRKSKILLAFGATVGLGLVIAIIFILTTLNQIPLDEVQSVLTRSVTTTAAKASSSSKLEGGSLVQKRDLETYLMLSSNPAWVAPDNAWTQQRDQSLALERDFEIPPPHHNDCAEVYCIQNRRPFREVPSVLWRGLIGIEDIRFLGHVGFDIRAIARALVRDVIAMGFVEGGSTITQQLAKNLFLSSEKSIWRKLKELVVAVAIEARFEKDEIIQAYLNEVYWGVLQGVRVKGFHAASVLYFQKLPRDLDSFEAIMLVSLLKGPNYYHPLRRMERLRERVEGVVQALKEKGVVENDMPVWSDKQWQQWHQRLSQLELATERPMYAWWLSTKSASGPLEDFGKFVFIQSAQKVLARSRERAPDTDLAVKAIVRPWKTQGGDFYFYSKIERETKTAIFDERHQVGSTLKPLIYSTLVSLGVDLELPVETAAIELNLKSGRWKPEESHNVSEDYIAFSEALRQSLNRPLIRMAKEIGFDLLEENLKTKIPNLKTPLAEYPAQLLGAVELSVEELAMAYKQFFDVECSENGSGVMNILDDPKQTTIKRVVGKVMAQMRFFGKTGTTNGGRDNWFVFFDGTVISAIWVGQETDRSSKELPLYGSSTSFRILETYLMYRGKLFNDLHCVMPEVDQIPMDTAI